MASEPTSHQREYIRAAFGPDRLAFVANRRSVPSAVWHGRRDGRGFPSGCLGAEALETRDGPPCQMRHDASLLGFRGIGKGTSYERNTDWLEASR